MILIDTGPIVALCDPRDGQHAVALSQVARLVGAGLRTCDAVITEAVFHLPASAQRRRLALLLDELDIEVAPTHEAPFVNETFAWLQKYASHEPDWADACLAVLCSRNSRVKVWTYDREFRTIWRKPDGRPIPMAVKAGG